jgi:alpha-amylase
VGIPLIYYGSEQGFSGGDDPKNREPLWNNFNQNHEIYLFIQKILNARTQTQWYKYEQIQQYSDFQFYAFSRGTSLFLSTNQRNQVIRTLTSHPYKNGDVICNVFWYDSDCIKVQNGQITIYLNNGESKIYVLKENTFALE